jgi:hypothetical protein
MAVNWIIMTLVTNQLVSYKGLVLLRIKYVNDSQFRICSRLREGNIFSEPCDAPNVNQ